MSGNKENKAIILRLFASYGKEDQKQRMEIYLQVLEKKNLTTKEIYDLVENAIEKSTYLPSIAEILKPIYDKVDNGTDKFLEDKWSEFYNVAVMGNAGGADWLFDIKRTLGWSRVENIKSDELKWLKKEFMAVFQVKFNNLIEDHKQLLLENTNKLLIGE